MLDPLLNLIIFSAAEFVYSEVIVDPKAREALKQVFPHQDILGILFVSHSKHHQLALSPV